MTLKPPLGSLSLSKLGSLNRRNSNSKKRNSMMSNSFVGKKEDEEDVTGGFM